MSEWRLFDAGMVPECATVEWYAEREQAPHLEQEGHRQRLLLTAELVADTVVRGARTVSDFGAGDGGLLQAVRDLGVTVSTWGYDLQPSNVAAAIDRGVTVELADFLSDQVRVGDTVVVAEVLEHLIDPHAAVRQLATSGARWLVASSPYTETNEHHYDFHLWAWDLAGYWHLLEDAGWRVRRVETAWISQVLLAEAPR